MNVYHIDPTSLRVFLVAARHLNLTRTANEVHMTLSAVSKRISELENHTGCLLFQRKARGLELTTAGRALIEHAQRVLFDMQQLSSDMRAFANGEKGLIRIWANTSAIIQFLPQDLASFTKQHPDIQLGLEEKHSHEIITALDQEQIDIGIFAYQFASANIQTTPYRTDELVLLTPIDHPLAHYKKIDFYKALDFDFVGLTIGSSLNQLIEEGNNNIRFRVQVSSFDAICRMVAIGLGVSVLPIQAIAQGMIDKSLRIVKLNDAWAHRTLWLGHHKHKRLSPDALKLFEFLKNIPL